MLLFSGTKLKQSFNGKDIFQDINLEVQCGEKVGLVGPNGVGKTTLLKIIAGIDEPAAGKVTFFKPVTKAMLVQVPHLPYPSTVRSVLESALPPGSGRLQLNEAIKRFRFTGMEDNPAAKLSSGEKTRLQLACIWLKQTELLLLDEPTNHLDMKELNRLEEFIRSYPGTVIIVSHDRYFLDKAVTRILELRADSIHSYPGNYSYYKQAKDKQFETDLKTYEDQEKDARKIEKQIREQKQWAEKGHRESRKNALKDGPAMGLKEFYRAKVMKIDRRVKNNIKRLERLQGERIARPKENVTIDLSFQAVNRGSGVLVTAECLGKSFGQIVLFKKADFSLCYGDKVALTGENGAGKTTLLKIITGMEKPDSGKLWLSPSLKTGYLEQELQSFQSDRALTRPVIDELMNVAGDSKAVHARARNLLAALLIRGETVYKPCALLSCGERVRVAMVKLLLDSYDLLILDEPTNYLDLESRERLEEALTDFKGSLIIVSHDRYFLEKVCNRVWAIEEKAFHTYPGRYSEYESHKAKGVLPPADLETSRLKFELRLAFLTGELAKYAAEKNTEKYTRLEQEYFQTLSDLRRI